jgi:hypothetical protein
MIYLTVSVEREGEVRSDQSSDPLHFAREVQARVLYRAVIDGVVIEDDGSVLDDRHAIGTRLLVAARTPWSQATTIRGRETGCLQLGPYRET